MLTEKSILIINNLLEKNDMKQSELAKKMHMYDSALSRVLKRTRKLSADELEKMSNIFNVSTDYILGKKESGRENEINDLDDMSTLMMFEGRPIPEEDRETVKAVLRSLRQRREEMDKKKDDK